MPDLAFSTSVGSSIIPGAAFLTETNPVALEGSAVTVNTDSKICPSLVSGSSSVLPLYLPLSQCVQLDLV